MFALTQKLVKGFTATAAFQALGLTTMLKLHHHTRRTFATRDAGANAACDAIVAHIRTFTDNVDIELQQRATEYVEMLSGRWDAHRVKDGSKLLLDHVLEQMPAAVEREEMDDDEEEGDEFASSDDEDASGGGARRGTSAAPAAAPAGDMDLLGDMFGSGDSGGAAPAPAAPGASDMDLLGDMFGSGSAAAAPPAVSAPNVMDLFGGAAAAAPAPSSLSGDVIAAAPAVSRDVIGAMDGLDLMGGGGAAAAAPAFPPLQAYSRSGVTVVFSFQKPAGATAPACVVTATATNVNSYPVSNYQLQISLPKVRRVLALPVLARRWLPCASCRANDRRSPFRTVLRSLWRLFRWSRCVLTAARSIALRTSLQSRSTFK